MKSMCHDARRNSPSVADRMPGLALELDDLLDRLVLDLPEVDGAELAGGVVLACLQQVRWPQQAADVVGAERRGVAKHGSSSSGRR